MDLEEEINAIDTRFERMEEVLNKMDSRFADVWHLTNDNSLPCYLLGSFLSLLSNLTSGRSMIYMLKLHPLDPANPTGDHLKSIFQQCRVRLISNLC